MKNTKKGFTLVELLVVIAILAILATVSVVGYTSFINRANQSAVAQELTQIRDAVIAEDILNPNFEIKNGKITLTDNTNEGYLNINAFISQLVSELGSGRVFLSLDTNDGALLFANVDKKAMAIWNFATGEITTGKYDESSFAKELFSASVTLGDGDVLLGALTNGVTISKGGLESATLPADVKIKDGTTQLDFTIKEIEANGNISVDNGDIVLNLDVHIEGIASDNNQPIVVKLGKVLPTGLDETELKLYHVENGRRVEMTKVASAANFEIHNQYTYDPATGEVTIYVASFSTFYAVQTTASKWVDDTVADTSWYNENASEFVLEDVADFLGFRDLVDSGVTFAGKTVKLGVDIDLNGKLFNPIGGGWAYQNGKTFNGTFDGDNHTIYNIYVNGWELDETGDTHSGTSKGAGLFSSIHNATIKNLVVVGAEMVVETTSIGIIAGCAQGVCTFENIIVSNASLGNYQMRNGGIVGDIYFTDDDKAAYPDVKYTHTFKNIVVDSSVKLSSMWGDFDTANGGVIGARYGSSTILMQNITVAAELDIFSDVTSAYQWYSYRRCGMLIGHTGQNSPKKSEMAAAPFLDCVNVNVYYGSWVNYNYYEFANQDSTKGQRYPWVRAEASDYNSAFSNVRYGVPTHNNVKVTNENKDQYKTDYAFIPFNQLYGGGQGVYGQATHDGVTVTRKLTKTIYFQNTKGWTDLSLMYWVVNGTYRWTNLEDAISIERINKDGEGVYDIYKIVLPAYATDFQINGTKGNATESTPHYNVSDIIENNLYSLTSTGGLNSCKYVEGYKTIYFQNNWKWSTPYVYYFYTDDNGHAWYDAEWPGLAMTKKVGNDGTYDIYEVKIPAYATAFIFNGVNPEGENQQTVNLSTSDAKDGYVYGMSYVANAQKHNVYSLPYVSGYKTIYFQNNWDWGTPQYSYMGVTIDMKWVKNEGTYDLYSFNIPNFVTEFKVLGGGEESINISNSSVTSGKTYSMLFSSNQKKLVESVKISFKPNTYWKTGNMWFAARIWNDSGEAWFKMNADGSTGYYYCYIPQGYDDVIFCRMGKNNNSTTDYSWNNRWNQTADVKISKLSNNTYTMNEEIYFKPDSNWKSAKARFAAYFFGNGEKWVSMVDREGDGVYECEIPSGYTKVIFVRMDPNNSTNSWSSKWTQTEDLTMQSGKYLFTLKDNSSTDGNTKASGSWGN